MPLYEYECEACGARFELIRKFSDPPADTCKVCGAGPLRKLVSSPAFHLKGSGWYATDYARKGEAPTDKKDNKEEKGSGASADSGKESAKDSGGTKDSGQDSSKDSGSAKPATTAPAKDSSS